MASDFAGEANGWFTRERVLTLALALVTLILIYVCYLMVVPFLPALAFALALAVATNGTYQKLRRRVGKDTLAATIGVIAVAILIIAPIASLAALLVDQAAENINQLREGTEVAGWRAAVERNPFGARLLHLAEERFNLQAQVQKIGEAVAVRATGFLKSSIGVITQLVITLFVLFFLYRDSESARAALRSMVPLSDREASRMFKRVASTIHATVNGSITVAIVQSILGGLMYWLLGVPAPALWAALTFICALVPVFGTFLVWGPIALYLGVTGSWGKAALLAGWGLLAVGSIDNVLYPFLVGDKLRLHTVPTFFALLGGISLFGASGLILGPMILAVTIGLLDIWFRRTEDGQAAEEAVAGTSTSPPPGTVLHERGGTPE